MSKQKWIFGCYLLLLLFHAVALTIATNDKLMQLRCLCESEKMVAFGERRGYATRESGKQLVVTSPANLKTLQKVNKAS